MDDSEPSGGSDHSDADEAAAAAAGDAEESVLTTEKLKPRKKLPPLLVALSDRKPERLHWLGVSYGVTLDLFNFWQRGDYVLVYLRQTPNDLTGEHTAIMLKALTSGRGGPDAGWLTGTCVCCL